MNTGTDQKAARYGGAQAGSDDCTSRAKSVDDHESDRKAKEQLEKCRATDRRGPRMLGEGVRRRARRGRRAPGTGSALAEHDRAGARGARAGRLGPGRRAGRGRHMEDQVDEAFNAGRGSALCADGSVEMSAALMRGSDHAVGAVTGVTRSRSRSWRPERCWSTASHVLLAGAAADQHAASCGVDQRDPSWFIDRAPAPAMAERAPFRPRDGRRRAAWTLAAAWQRPPRRAGGAVRRRTRRRLTSPGRRDMGRPAGGGVLHRRRRGFHPYRCGAAPGDVLNRGEPLRPRLPRPWPRWPRWAARAA